MNIKSKPFYLDNEAVHWVEKIKASMTLEEKVGQLFCLIYREGTEKEHRRINSVLSPGGAMYRPLPVEKAVKLTNLIQSQAKIPYLLAANLEKGGNGVVEEGTLLGSPMEIAATDDAEMAAKLGRICGAEGSAAGCNWAFAPIIDIDMNFRNPITNTRTFGSDVNRVKDMGVAYVKEVQKHGVAASIKHFPGDGVDERDQHLVTSINSLSCEEWDNSFGEVYGAAIEAGALTCMVGHIMLPSYSKYYNPSLKDSEIMPASLSKELMTNLLREKLGFNGLIITDATTMAGYTIPMSRKTAVPTSIARGADMFLFTRNLEEDYHYMLEGVKNGIITQERLEEAVTRILALKAALKLHKGAARVSMEEANKRIGCKEHIDWARECADKAITLVKEEEGVLPLTVSRYRRILFYGIEASGGAGQYFVEEGICKKVMNYLKKEGFDVDLFVPSQGKEGQTVRYSDVTDNYDLIIYVSNLSTKSNQTMVRIEWAQPMGADCPHYIEDVPTIFISLENPYHLLDVPRIRTFINTYNSNEFVLEALIDKLMGRSEFKGVNPVDPFCGKWDTVL